MMCNALQHRKKLCHCQLAYEDSHSSDSQDVSATAVVQGWHCSHCAYSPVISMQLTQTLININKESFLAGIPS